MDTPASDEWHEALVGSVHGQTHLKDQKGKTELASLNRELKRLKAQVAALEERRAKLIGGAGR